MKIMTLLKIGAVAGLFGLVAVVPGSSAILGLERGESDPAVGETAEDPATSDAPVDPGAGPVTGPGETGGPVQTKPGLQCTRSKNGGATDVGVTANKIRLASTVVQSGPGESFLGDSPFGLQAVVRTVNSSGGICGRLIDLKLVDDGWDAQRGLSFIKTFIAEKYFALPVVPSSEGLTAAIESGDIKKAGIPVIGTDGMLKQQYEDPWVWPVATATVSTMRIMAHYGYTTPKIKARCFGIVYDTRYRFGKEGADAYANYVKKLPGARLCAREGIYPARASYSSEIQSFNTQCDGKCDFVALLLEPGTALTWIAGRPQMGTKATSGAQTLFNEDFAANCAQACNGLLAWTGYNPPIGNLAGLEDVGKYVNDIKSVSPTADTYNQFLEGAYLGMRVFVEALRRVGPDLTRANLARVMNAPECFEFDIASKLCWSAKKRNANKSAQAFSFVVAQGSFAGFRNEQTGFIADPEA